MIHVCFGLYDKTGRYSKFTGTAMLSIFENTTSPITVHILHDNTLTEDNRDKFIYIAGCYSQTVKFYNVEEMCPEKIEDIKKFIPWSKNSILTIGALYRLLTPQLISNTIEKVIYLDADIIVNLDIKELWQIDLGDKILAAIPELFNGIDIKTSSVLCKEGYVKNDNYFNSGVLIMNLKIFRLEQETLNHGIKFVGQSPRFSTLDQDVLNYLFSEDYLKLPVKFNYFVKTHRSPSEIVSFGKIYHYTATPYGVGLSLDMSDEFNRLWMKYFVKTPWFNEETIGHIYTYIESLLKGQTELKKAALNLSAAMKIKARAFVTLESKIEKLVKDFSVRKDEEIFIINQETPVKNLIDEINASRGEKIFFILLPNCSFNMLEEAGLVRGKDFINGFDFLPERYYSLVSEI